MRAPTRKMLALKFEPVASSSKPPTLPMPIVELFAIGILSQSKGSMMNSMMIIVGSRPTTPGKSPAQKMAMSRTSLRSHFVLVNIS